MRSMKTKPKNVQRVQISNLKTSEILSEFDGYIRQRRGAEASEGEAEEDAKGNLLCTYGKVSDKASAFVLLV